MIVLFYFFAVLAGMATLWCGYLAMVPLEALQRGAALGILELQAALAFLTMVVCLAAASLLQRLDALRQDDAAPPLVPPRTPRARL